MKSANRLRVNILPQWRYTCQEDDERVHLAPHFTSPIPPSGIPPNHRNRMSNLSRSASRTRTTETVPHKFITTNVIVSAACKRALANSTDHQNSLVTVTPQSTALCPVSPQPPAHLSWSPHTPARAPTQSGPRHSAVLPAGSPRVVCGGGGGHRTALRRWPRGYFISVPAPLAAAAAAAPAGQARE